METVLVAIGGGLAGALVTTLLRIRHERQEQFRDRMMTAADDFATGTMQALIAVRDARGAFGKAVAEDPLEEALDRAWRLADEAQARMARIDLLFGADSPAGVAGDVAIARIRRVIAALQDPRDDEESIREALDLLGDAAEWYEDALADYVAFCDEARDAIRGRPWWHRAVTSMRSLRARSPSRERAQSRLRRARLVRQLASRSRRRAPRG